MYQPFHHVFVAQVCVPMSPGVLFVSTDFLPGTIKLLADDEDIAQT